MLTNQCCDKVRFHESIFRYFAEELVFTQPGPKADIRRLTAKAVVISSHRCDNCRDLNAHYVGLCLTSAFLETVGLDHFSKIKAVSPLATIFPLRKAANNSFPWFAR